MSARIEQVEGPDLPVDDDHSLAPGTGDDFSNEELRQLITTQLVVSYNLYRSLKQIAEKEQGAFNFDSAALTQKINDVLAEIAELKKRKSTNTVEIITFILISALFIFSVFFRR